METTSSRLRKRKNRECVAKNEVSPNSEADTQAKLIRAAKTLFADKGYDATTIKDISQAAHVNISLVSYYFNGKEGLYRTCIEQFGKARLRVAERVLQAPQSAEEFRFRLQLFVEEVINAHIEEPEVAQILTRELERHLSIGEDIFRNTFLRIHETMLNFLKSGQDQGIIRKEIDTGILAILLIGGILHLVQKDRMHQLFFGRSIQDKKFRDEVISNTVSFSLRGCLVTQSSS